MKINTYIFSHSSALNEGLNLSDKGANVLLLEKIYINPIDIVGNKVYKDYI